MKISKWEIVGIIAAIFNPVPTGIVAGYALFTEKKYRRVGIAVILLSVILFAATLYLLYTNQSVGPII